MDSGRPKTPAVDWAGLPSELLGLISGSLGNAGEIVRFRSICRPWRSSTPPPPNKLSPLFPRKTPFFVKDNIITSNAVYLLRPRSDPTKAWLVSVQESAPGKLVLRHALTYNEMNNEAELDLEADWIVATQTPIVRFYSHSVNCSQCKTINLSWKVVFASESKSKSGSGCSELVGFLSYPDLMNYAFKPDIGGDDFNLQIQRGFEDYAGFSGRIFVVDVACSIYLLDHTNLQLVQVMAAPNAEDTMTKGDCTVKFVESDGHLYVVRFSYENLNASACEIYRLDIDEKNKILIERVGDLGGRVFFLTRNFSFSIAARLLPHPWREGNCIFIPDIYTGICCRCCARINIKYKHRVFHLGSKTFTELWTPKGHSYSDLFNPPVSFVAEEFEKLK